MDIDIIPINSNKVRIRLLKEFLSFLLQYTPQEYDLVIGTIVQKNPEIFTLDINSESYASLSSLEFQNATNKERPKYSEGTLVYCRILSQGFNKFAKTQLSCINLTEKKAWNSGEALFGELKGGFVRDFPIGFCRFLQSYEQEDGILFKLGEKIPYDIIIGANGKIWIKTEKPMETIFIFQALERVLELGHNEEAISSIMKTLPA